MILPNEMNTVLRMMFQALRLAKKVWKLPSPTHGDPRMPSANL